MLVAHLYNHENKGEAAGENTVSILRQHLRWNDAKVLQVTAVSSEQGLITLGPKREKLFLTETGRRLAQEVWERGGGAEAKPAPRLPLPTRQGTTPDRKRVHATAPPPAPPSVPDG